MTDTQLVLNMIPQPMIIANPVRADQLMKATSVYMALSANSTTQDRRMFVAGPCICVSTGTPVVESGSLRIDSVAS